MDQDGAPLFRHSVEMWHLDHDDNGTLLVMDGMGGIVARLNEAGQGDRVRPNAARIVACVNACAGIGTESLMRLPDKELAELLRLAREGALTL